MHLKLLAEGSPSTSRIDPLIDVVIKKEFYKAGDPILHQRLVHSVQKSTSMPYINDVNSIQRYDDASIHIVDEDPVRENKLTQPEGEEEVEQSQYTNEDGPAGYKLRQGLIVEESYTHLPSITNPDFKTEDEQN